MWVARASLRIDDLVQKRIEEPGGQVVRNVDGSTGVIMAKITTDADLGDLCEQHRLVYLRLEKTEITDQGLLTVSGLCEQWSRQESPPAATAVTWGGMACHGSRPDGLCDTTPSGFSWLTLG
jgi:hypothetical protein